MQYICRTRAQTKDFSHNSGQKDEEGCNSFKYYFPHLPGHRGTLTTLVVITTGVSPHSGLWVIRPGPPSRTLCLVSSCSTRAPKHRHRNSKIQRYPEYRMSGRLSLLTLLNRGRPSLSPPSVSSYTSPLLLLQTPTGPRITHQTRSPGSVTLGSFMPGGFYTKTNKLAVHLVSPNELSQSHQHSRVMWALLLVIQ